MKVKEILNKLELLAPQNLKEEYDNVGLMLGNPENEVSSIVVCLDITNEVVSFALSKKSNLIIAHHPFFFQPISCIDTSIGKGKIVKTCIVNDINILAVHTNLDKAENGMNATMSKLLSGKNIELNQNVCCALFDIKPTGIKDFACFVSEKLNDDTVCYSNIEKTIRRVAVCTGGGGSDNEIYKFAKENADVFLSGDFKHHNYIDAIEDDFAIIAFSHYSSEIIVEDILENFLCENTKGIQIYKANQKRPYNKVV